MDLNFFLFSVWASGLCLLHLINSNEHLFRFQWLLKLTLINSVLQAPSLANATQCTSAINYHLPFSVFYLISDNVIKVWRLFPYATEALSPMMSFYCSQTPLHMCIMTGKLGVAFHEHASATYSVVVYNLTNKCKYRQCRHRSVYMFRLEVQNYMQYIERYPILVYLYLVKKGGVV